MSVETHHGEGMYYVDTPNKLNWYFVTEWFKSVLMIANAFESEHSRAFKWDGMDLGKDFDLESSVVWTNKKNKQVASNLCPKSIETLSF